MPVVEARYVGPKNVKACSWSPLGDQICITSLDENGRDVISILDLKSGTVDLIGRGYYQPMWSPDGDTIACRDITGQLHFYDVKSGTFSFIYPSTMPQEMAWSQTGKHIAIVMMGPNQPIVLTKDGEKKPVTNPGLQDNSGNLFRFSWHKDEVLAVENRSKGLILFEDYSNEELPLFDQKPFPGYRPAMHSSTDEMIYVSHDDSNRRHVLELAALPSKYRLAEEPRFICHITEDPDVALWSPNGLWMLFRGPASASFDPDARDLTYITGWHLCHYEKEVIYPLWIAEGLVSPSWSPEGNRIAFVDKKIRQVKILLVL